METNNKTVKQICEELRQFKCDGDYVREIEDLADEAEAAHKRDVVAYELELDRWFHQGHKDRAKMKSLRTKNEKLRKLVGELADALESRLCDFDCEIHGECLADMEREECESFKMRPLVARAREAIGGGVTKTVENCERMRCCEKRQESAIACESCIIKDSCETHKKEVDNGKKD